jgi:antitoxin MazE
MSTYLPRYDWEKSFQMMHELGEDVLLLDDVFEDENLEEWNLNDIN